MTKSALEYQSGSVQQRSSDFRRLYILASLYVGCTVFYYFGELVDLAGWESLRWEFFYTVHDLHRLFFLAPIIYAAYFFGVKATIIVTIVAINTLLPRALFISPFPDPLLRMVIFILVAGTMGYLTARLRSESERRSRLEALVRSERDRLLGILERMPDGVLITGPDYRIRFLNPSLVRDFGEGVGSYCYQYLYKSDEPCRETCRLPRVLSGAVDRWEYRLPDGRTYEVVASPYIDSDGTVCQLTTFRELGKREKPGQHY